MAALDYTQVTMTTYASDVSGAASALYELGGMTVIHDASGCNSTYSTHDEPRWETMNSAVYVSALNEMDAVLGNEDVLEASLADAVKSLKPAFTSLAGTIIPMMTGSDLKGIARRVEEETGRPAFALSTNGMRAYSVGAAQAWIELARRFVEPPEAFGADLDADGDGSVNLIGATPLDFSICGELEAIKTLLAAAAIRVNACWAMGSSLEALAATRRASLNLVLSSAGLPLAQVFARHFGMPFLAALPIGEGGAQSWIGTVRQALSRAQAQPFPLPEPERDLSRILGRAPDAIPDAASRSRVLVIHEPLRAVELARAVERDVGLAAAPLSALPALGVGDPALASELSEDDFEALFRSALEGARSRGEPAPAVLGDPLFESMARRAGLERFVALPHEAASGRIWRSETPNVFEPGAWRELLSRIEKAAGA